MNYRDERERAAFIEGASASIYKTCGPLAERIPDLRKRSDESPSEWRDRCINRLLSMF